MRILVITSSFLPRVGGLEMCVHNLAYHWGQMGHEVMILNEYADIVSHPEANYKLKKLVNLKGGYRFGWHKYPWNKWAQWQIARLIDHFQPAYVSAHCAYPCGIWLGNISPSKPWTLTCHAADIQISSNYGDCPRIRFNLDNLLSNSLSKATRVIAISDYIKSLIYDLKISEDKIVKIPVGADSRIGERNPSIDIKRQLGIGANCRYILSVGRNVYEKGFDLGIAAFSKIAKQFPDINYVIIGKDSASLYSTADAYGVGDRFITSEVLMGKELYAAYQGSILYFSPSRIEGFPLVGVEALMAGLPLLMTNCHGNREVVKNGFNGQLCEVNDVDNMASCLHMMLSNANVLTEYGLQSKLLSRAFDWKKIANAYLDCIP